jgi:transcriptional regulator with XRE-family HTH domain
MKKRMTRVRIREIRNQRGQTLTQFHKYLTEDLGVAISLPQLSRMDRGKKGASIPKLQELATALDRTMESLIELPEESCTQNN